MDRINHQPATATLYRFPTTAAERANFRRGRLQPIERAPQVAIMPETGWYHDEAMREDETAQ